MENIDWSKAPEGYPVWVEDLMGGRHDWHNDSGDRWVDVRGCYWEKSAEARDHCRAHYKPEPSEWSGQGLLPVGTVCEWYSDVYGWLGGKVIGHDGTVSVVSHNDGYTGCHLHNLRPVRTPEQIAADEREAAVAVMGQVISRDEDRRRTCCASCARAAAEALYAAGYRKP